MQRAVRLTLAKAFSREQLGLRLSGQVGYVEDVLDDQRVDHVFKHPHKIGVELRIAAIVASAADKGLYLGMAIRQELVSARARLTMAPVGVRWTYGMRGFQ